MGVGSWGPGLLVSRHASKSLKRAVEECGHPMGSKDGVMLEAGEAVRGRLYSSLQEVVEVGARLAAVTD